MQGVNKHKVPYVICLNKERKHAIKTTTYKHVQDSIHVYKFGSHVHALRHVTPYQNNIKKLKEASLESKLIKFYFPNDNLADTSG